MAHSESIKNITVALVRARGAMANAKKNARNPHLKNWYADLEAVLEATLTPLAECGIAVVQLPESTTGEIVSVTTMLVHESGEWISASLTLRPTKPDPQGIGSAITYGRRYTLSSLCALTQADDDGDAASRAARAPAQAQAAPQRTPAGFSDRIASADSRETLQAIAADIAKAGINGGEREELIAQYKSRMTELS